MRDSLALRERVADFAAEAQGLEAAELFLAAFGDGALMAGSLRLGRPRNLPRRRPQPPAVQALAALRDRARRRVPDPGREMRALRWLVAGGVAPAQGL